MTPDLTVLQLPAPNPVDEAALAQIHDAEQFLVKNYRKVLAALVEKAKAGSVDACDIVRKIVSDFKNQQEEHRPKRPTNQLNVPISIRIAEAKILCNLLGNEKPTIQMTAAEQSNLTLDQRETCKEFKIVEMPLIAPPQSANSLAEQGATTSDIPSEAVAPVLRRVPMRAAQQQPNVTCHECGEPFYSARPAQAKWCPDCLDTRQKRRLALHQASRGEKISPAINAAAPEIREVPKNFRHKDEL